MKRTKEWWARLTKTERSTLVYLERIESRGGGGGSSYLPDDCSECPNCSTPHLGYGLCPLCSKRMHALLRKANGGLFVITAAEIEAAESRW